MNDSLQYLDVGSNRLREKGILAIAEGIMGNKTCALKSIGLRFNFISDDGADKFFAMILGKSKIENIYIRNNHLTQPWLIRLGEQLEEAKMPVFVDALETVKNVD